MRSKKDVKLGKKLGQNGGLATLKKKGRKHFKLIAKKRWDAYYAKRNINTK